MLFEAEPGDEETNQAYSCDSLLSRGEGQCKGPGANGAQNVVEVARSLVLGVAM